MFIEKVISRVKYFFLLTYKLLLFLYIDANIFFFSFVCLFINYVFYLFLFILFLFIGHEIISAIEYKSFLNYFFFKNNILIFYINFFFNLKKPKTTFKYLLISWVYLLRFTMHYQNQLINSQLILNLYIIIN